jgi:N-acetyl sugar amidotransferase
MQYCKICLQPDTRPNTIFSSDGICPACTYFDALKQVDWDERLEVLKEIISKRARSRGNFHDCIIGVSGGKDSTRQAIWARDFLGLNPLLVCLSYPPEQVTQRGVDNLSNLINLGFDVLVSAPAPGTWRSLKRDGFEEYTNSFRSTEMALFSCVPQIALRYGIDLILWGENPGLQLGDMKTLGRSGYDGNNLRYMNTLSSGKEWMQQRGYNEGELIAYTYPEVEDFLAADLRIIYLGWFLGDWSLVNNATYSCGYGLKIRNDDVTLTGDLFGVTALDEDFTPINQMIKYYKYGFGRTTDYVNEEIRLARMSREKGIELVTKYDHKCSSQYIEYYCNYLDISVEQFWVKIRKSTNSKLFIINSHGFPIPRFKVGTGL